MEVSGGKSFANPFERTHLILHTCCWGLSRSLYRIVLCLLPNGMSPSGLYSSSLSVILCSKINIASVSLMPNKENSPLPSYSHKLKIENNVKPLSDDKM